MLRPKIGLDWDDVTAPYNSIAIEMANEKYNIEPKLTLSDVTSWENTGRASVIKEFYDDPELYKKQSQRISDITKFEIRKLMEFADVYFITAVAPKFMGVRAQQILEAFPELSERRIIMGAAKNLVHFDIILDDNITNVLESPADYAVIMRKPWNADMTGILSVNTMSEFVTLVKHIMTASTFSLSVSKQPCIIALVGPSGSRKNDIANELVVQTSCERPISYSTKNIPAYAHQYLSQEEFNATPFFEKTMYGGYSYGTKEEDIIAILNRGHHVILPMDIGGAIAMSDHFPTVIVYCNRRKNVLVETLVMDDLISPQEKTLRILSIDAEKKNKKLCHICIDTEDQHSAVEELKEMFSL